MTAGMAVLVCALGFAAGYIAARGQNIAGAERATERLRPHGPPRSHCHPFHQPTAYDQDTDPTGAASPGGGGVPGRTRALTATSGVACGPGGALTSASRAAPHPPEPTDR